MAARAGMTPSQRNAATVRASAHTHVDAPFTNALTLHRIVARRHVP